MLLKIIIILLIIVLLSYSILPTFLYKVNHKLFQKSKYKNSKERVIYLTFDDGPHIWYTPEILNVLKKYNVKATFFVVASFARENPEIIKRMEKEGHAIGLHSLEHKNALFQSKSYTEYDFGESIKIMNDLNIDVKFFRPPWGHFNIITAMQIKKYNLKPVMWDVMAQDWEGDTIYEIIVDKLMRRSKDNNIICLHDGRGKNEAPRRTIKALEKVLPVWKKEGYKFLTVEE
ncbi:MAG: polysaccharide deacetylase family protein [Terrisporobacter sp.]|uniref:polysaccharide deacetylase family protein n=1 Tax=Terrisporobacter sp. TaxID=1965305 RepID=UPI002FCA95F6